MKHSQTGPQVSVITVCYNAAATIADTLDSVRRQTWRPLESIVVDGASTDGTQDIVAHYNDITSTVVSAKDDGIYDAMNKGIGLARGEILHFLNADDSFVDDQGVAEVVRVFQSEPDIDLVFGDAVYRTKDGDFLRKYRRVTARSLLYGDLCHQVVFARRRLFESFGNFNLEYRINADYEWLLRVFRGGAKARYLPRPVANFRVGGACGRDLAKTRAERKRVHQHYASTQSHFVFGLMYRAMRKARHIMGERDLIPVKTREP